MSDNVCMQISIRNFIYLLKYVNAMKIKIKQ